MKSYTELILTVYDRPNDKYTCNVCSALLNIRPANAAGKAYHYFLLSTSQHSLPASQSPPPSQLSPTLLSPHNLPSAHQFTQGRGRRRATMQEIQTPGKYVLRTRQKRLNLPRTSCCICTF